MNLDAVQDRGSTERGTTQHDRILAYMCEFGSITPLEAMRDIGVLALSQRIGELKRGGVGIITEMEVVKNRYGQDCRVARYRMGELHEQQLHI